jgi:WD repeat-containing protein 92
VKYSSILQIYELNKGDLDLVGDFVKPHGIKCGTFGASSIEERHLATGDHVGKLTIYDLDRIDTPVFSQHVLILKYPPVTTF